MSDDDMGYLDDDDEEDDFDECGQFLDGGVLVCAMIGSEFCDWDCPFSKDLGKRLKSLRPK